MQTFTPNNLPLQLQRSSKSSGGSLFSPLRLLFCFVLFNTVFIPALQAQQCPYDISLVSRTYNSSTNRTTFVWKVVNPNPGNGNNGTVQGLSHWGFMPNTCTNPADALKQSDIVSAGSGKSSNPAQHNSTKVKIERDPSQNCTGNTPVIKFDAKGGDDDHHGDDDHQGDDDHGDEDGSGNIYYSLVLTGNWGPADLHAFYKSGSRTGCGLCNIAGAGIGCRIASCPAISVKITTSLSQFPTNRTVALSTNITGGAIPYTYIWSSPTAGITFNNASSQNPVATVPSGVSGFSFNVTVTDANGCQGTANINLSQADLCNILIPLISTNPICAGTSNGMITVSNPQVGQTYQLFKDGVEVGGAVTYSSGTLSFAGLTAGNYFVRASMGSCIPVSSATIAIANITLPSPTFNTVGTMCPGATTTLSATFPSGTTVSGITWSGTGVTGTTFTAPATPGNYTINFSASVNGCTLTTTRTITVANTPSPVFGPICTLCPGASASLTATFPAGTTVSNIVWSGTGVSGTTFTAPATAGAYTVNYSATVNGCSVTGSLDIIVAATPSPTFGEIGPLCPGSSASLTATYPAGTTVTNEIWSGTGVSGTTFTAPLTVGTYTVNYSATVNSCVVTSSRTITVAAAPSPVFTPIGTLCAGVAAQLIATFPAGTSVSNVVWSGTGVSGSVFTAPMVTSQTSYTVNYSATVNSCTVTGSQTILVNPIPNPLYLAVYDYCPGGTGGRIEVRNIEAGVSYQIRIVGGAAIGPVLTGAAGTNLNFTNIPAGYYQILATNLTTGCVNPFGGATVSQLAIPPCSITGPASVCMGTTNTYTVTTGSGTTNIQWSVQGGNCTIVGGASASIVSIKAVGPGTYTVRVTVSYGDCSTTCEQVVNSTPLTVTADNFIACPNATINLTGSPAGGMWASTNTQVQAAINNIASTFNSTGIPVGNYPVTYTVTQDNACTGTALGSITVFGSSVIGNLTGARIPGTFNSLNVTLDDTKKGVIYQLMRDGVMVGSPVKGNGSLISFGTQESSGTYSVVARTESGDCEINGTGARLTQRLSGSLFNSSNKLQVIAYPNPFSTQVRFSITSPESGKGMLQLFDLKGALLKTMDVGSIIAGQTINVDYAVPGQHRVSMTYKLNVGDQEATGKLINIK